MPSAAVRPGSVVYKICPLESWLAARSSGALSPSRDDERDGYIHLSAADQVEGSLARHFARQPDLVLLALHVDVLPAGALVWEKSRDGRLFPHLYGVLSADLVSSVIELPLDDQGLHQLPEGL
jgi:uncharacterized protein (DUF952 family)